jgi:hypothetical protein
MKKISLLLVVLISFISCDKSELDYYEANQTQDMNEINTTNNKDIFFIILNFSILDFVPVNY